MCRWEVCLLQPTNVDAIGCLLEILDGQTKPLVQRSRRESTLQTRGLPVDRVCVCVCVCVFVLLLGTGVQ